jgi:hypothetical protein
MRAIRFGGGTPNGSLREFFMPRHLRHGSRITMLAAGLLLITAGCTGGTAAVAGPSPSATAVPSATPRPSVPTRSAVPSHSASPSPSASLAPAGGPIAVLEIGAPYTLVFNPANPALHADFSFQMGSISVTETMNGREIHQRGKAIGLAYVLELTGVPMSDAVFEGGARGAAANTGGKLSYGKVLGHKVAYIVTKPASFAMYRDGDVIVMVGAQTLSLTKTLVTSVIKANS